ncbi:MAG: VWA domain-containing protein [Luteitalea sp.]|nr:VWA domain-containing protein [Luteitalea sp.]
MLLGPGNRSDCTTSSPPRHFPFPYVLRHQRDRVVADGGIRTAGGAVCDGRQRRRGLRDGNRCSRGAGLWTERAGFRDRGRRRTRGDRLVRGGELPLALAVAIDRSFSISEAHVAGVASAVKGWLRELRPRDEVMLLAIGSENEVLHPLSADRGAAGEALARLRRWGTTPLHDAVLAALSSIQAGHGRRALVLLSDGRDRYSLASAADVIERARRADVLVYPVALAREPPSLFTGLASATGGRSFQAADVGTLPSTLSTIARELRSQYLLGYTPSRPMTEGPAWRSIRVTVNRPGVRVRAREGYLAR